MYLLCGTWKGKSKIHPLKHWLFAGLNSHAIKVHTEKNTLQNVSPQKILDIYQAQYEEAAFIGTR